MILQPSTPSWPSFQLAERTSGPVVDYLREENRLLKQQFRGQRHRLTDDDRPRLAAKGVLPGRKLLAQVATIVTPETILAWHRKLIGKAMTAGRQITDPSA